MLEQAVHVFLKLDRWAEVVEINASCQKLLDKPEVFKQFVGSIDWVEPQELEFIPRFKHKQNPEVIQHINQVEVGLFAHKVAVEAQERPKSNQTGNIIDYPIAVCLQEEMLQYWIELDHPASALSWIVRIKEAVDEASRSSDHMHVRVGPRLLGCTQLFSNKEMQQRFVKFERLCWLERRNFWDLFVILRRLQHTRKDQCAP